MLTRRLTTSCVCSGKRWCNARATRALSARNVVLRGPLAHTRSLATSSPSMSHTPTEPVDQGTADPPRKKTSMEMIAEIPVIEIENTFVMCDGATGSEFMHGHPPVWIQLNTVIPGAYATCKYCGLRYRMKAGHH